MFTTQIDPDHELLHPATVRRPKETDGKTAMPSENRARMGEFPEALYAVIRAHPGLADPSKRQVVIEDMPAPIVDRDAAGVRPIQHAP